MGGSGFFSVKTKLVKPEKIEKLVCTDVGSVGDRGFGAAAVAMVDNILAKPRANEDLARKLVELHKEYFPQQSIANSFQPTRDVRAQAKFLNKLALILRQVTVNEIVKEFEDELFGLPLQYRSAFIKNGKDGGTSPEKLRRQETWINDESANTALAKAMQLPIEVRVVAPGKLPLCLMYKSATESIGSPIVMQLQNQYYMPLLNKPDYFAGINKQTIEAINPVIKPRKKDPELAEILAKIAEHDKRLHEEFAHNKTWLNVLVEDGDVTKEGLFAIYIKGLKKSEHLQGRIKYGRQHFFDAINEGLKGSVEPIILAKGKNHDAEVIAALVEAIAQAISIKHMDPQLVEEAVVKSSVISEP